MLKRNDVFIVSCVDGELAGNNWKAVANGGCIAGMCSEIWEGFLSVCGDAFLGLFVVFQPGGVNGS
ncbi:MAG: hypothetical protein JKY93_09350 [Gammaproteobacteria bacterium]|nr:hypothetical protein [Gammaproteobacteria bacterium]